jgi:hypothetical protein
VEAQGQRVDVTEHLPGKPPSGGLPDLFENGVAQIVGKHVAEARAGIGKHQPGDDPERRVRRHSVHGKLQRIGEQQRYRLADDDQQDGNDDPRLQLAIALRPQHRKESDERREGPALNLISRFCHRP